MRHLEIAFVGCLATLNLCSVYAVLVGSILLPHGDFAYDPTLMPPSRSRERQVAQQIALASRRAGQWLLKSKPDVIFLSTPHGIKLDSNYGIYMSRKGKGYATIGNDLPQHFNRSYNVSLEIDLAPDLSQELLDLLQERNNVSGIYSYNDGSPMPLNWGEIIPLLLLPKNHHAHRQKHLIWSYPHRRYDHAPEMIPELLAIGNKIAQWTHARPERIAFIVSGDLSHTHQADGPYGYSNASVPFDAALGNWAANPCAHAAALLRRAKRLQLDAKSCGFTGYVLWHGIMCSLSSSTQYRSTVLVNHNVTYYGMMAATFAPTGGIGSTTKTEGRLS